MLMRVSGSMRVRVWERRAGGGREGKAVSLSSYLVAFISSAFLPKIALLPDLLISYFLLLALEQRASVVYQTSTDCGARRPGFPLQSHHLSRPINTRDMNEWGNTSASLRLGFLIWKDT